MRYQLTGLCFELDVRQSCDVQILESEGSMQSKINQAEGDKAEIILTSEAAKMDAINRATGATLLMPLFMQEQYTTVSA